jgi:hypothetical protein
MLRGVHSHAHALLGLTSLCCLAAGVSACSPPPDPYDTLAQWQTRAAEIRSGIVDHIQIDPDRPREPPEVIYRHGRQVLEGYTIENVAFAALPGLYVTGNLYRPTAITGPMPAIANPHGHFSEQGWWSRTRPDMQKRCATQARMGAVAFTWDMIGMGEARQLEHESPSSAAVLAYVSLRVIDFLQTLPEVDPDRIAVTGASAGASQAMVLTALDERPMATAPVAMVSATYAGGCACEDFYPEHLHGTLEVAALAAPRPQLVVSDGADWTADTAEVELPFLRGIYDLYDADSDIHGVHLANEGHDYGLSKRNAVYSFLAGYLNLSPAGPEPSPVPHTSLVVFDDAHPVPADALHGEEAIAAALELAAEP